MELACSYCIDIVEITTPNVSQTDPELDRLLVQKNSSASGDGAVHAPMHEGTPSETSPCDTDTTNKKKKLRYQTGPPFFEKVNVEVTNQFQSCKKYGPLHVSDEQPCLKFPVYGAKLHIGKNVEFKSPQRSDGL